MLATVSVQGIDGEVFTTKEPKSTGERLYARNAPLTTVFVTAHPVAHRLNRRDDIQLIIDIIKTYQGSRGLIYLVAIPYKQGTKLCLLSVLSLLKWHKTKHGQKEGSTLAEPFARTYSPPAGKPSSYSAPRSSQIQMSGTRCRCYPPEPEDWHQLRCVGCRCHWHRCRQGGCRHQHRLRFQIVGDGVAILVVSGRRDGDGCLFDCLCDIQCIEFSGGKSGHV